jgi:hypothetical protein
MRLINGAPNGEPGTEAQHFPEPRKASGLKK